MKKGGKKVDGAKFPPKKALFRPTAMSVAMAEAGIIPGTHVVKDDALTAVVRNRNDNKSQRPSIRLSF